MTEEERKQKRKESLQKYHASEKGIATRNRTRREHYKKSGVALKEKNYHLIKKYGINLETYNTMISNQQGLCAICGNPPKGKHQSGTPFSLHVDHNHTTGQVRSLLCAPCNTSLGHYEKNKEIFDKYLEIHLDK